VGTADCLPAASWFEVDLRLTFKKEKRTSGQASPRVRWTRGAVDRREPLTGKKPLTGRSR
jgi:hypothetical protein